MQLQRILAVGRGYPGNIRSNQIRTWKRNDRQEGERQGRTHTRPTWGSDPGTRPNQGNWRRALGGVEEEVRVSGGKATSARTHLERRLVEPANVDIRRCPETCGNRHLSTQVGGTGTESMVVGDRRPRYHAGVFLRTSATNDPTHTRILPRSG